MERRERGRNGEFSLELKRRRDEEHSFSGAFLDENHTFIALTVQKEARDAPTAGETETERGEEGK